MSPARSAFRPRWLIFAHSRWLLLRGNFHRHFGNISGERRDYQWPVDRVSREILKGETLRLVGNFG